VGFFHKFEPNEIVYKKWDFQQECVSDFVPNNDEMERLRINLCNIDKNLGAYPYSTYKEWISLSSYINPKIIKRLAPKAHHGMITSQKDLITQEQIVEQKMGDPSGLSIVNKKNPNRIRFSDADGLPLMYNKDDRAIKFSEVLQISLAETNIKKAGVGSTDRLLKLLSSVGEYRDLLGEFQYAFVVFLIGQVYEGFEQWKRLMHLICSCCKAIKSNKSLYNDLLMVLHFQLKMVPDDFFQDVLSNDNFIHATLILLFCNIQDTDGVSSHLKMKSEKFKKHLEIKFGKPFEPVD